MASLTRMFRLCQETHQRPFGEANSSNIAFEVPLAFTCRWWQSGLISHKDSQLHNNADWWSKETEAIGTSKSEH